MVFKVIPKTVAKFSKNGKIYDKNVIYKIGFLNLKNNNPKYLKYIL